MLRRLVAAAATLMFVVALGAGASKVGDKCSKHSECGPGEGCEAGVCVKKL